MNNIKFATAFILIILFSQYAFSQTGGISASKLVVINTETVPANKIEFEPAFNILIQNSDSLRTSSDFGFRFTYGLNNKTEIGISLPVNMQAISWGVKYNLANFNRLSFGMIAGIENALIVNNSKELKTSTFFNSYTGGIVSSYQINDKLSIDFDGQIENHFHYSKQDFNLFLNSEIGYFITDGLQLVSGIQYGNNPLTEIHENNLTLNSGMTVEKAKNFILVLNFPYQFKSKQLSSAFGFALALTILID